MRASARIPLPAGRYGLKPALPNESGSVHGERGWSSDDANADTRPGGGDGGDRGIGLPGWDIFGRPATTAGAGIAQADAGGSPQSAAPVQPAKDEGGVRSIELPAVALELPAGPGRDTITGACAFCHSNQYILMQPRFTRPQWTAEVDKMRKTYGAPLTDPQAADAVEYLVSVRGTEVPHRRSQRSERTLCDPQP